MDFEDSSEDGRPQIDAKIVLVGDGGVGKTSLILRFTKDTFQESYKATIGLDLFSKVIELEDGTIATLRLWDIAGGSIGAALINQYLEGADAVLVCYSIDDLESYNDVIRWRELISTIKGKTSNAFMVLVGTKSDLSLNRQAPVKGSAVDTLKWNGRIEVSSKLGGDSVNMLFKGIADLIKVGNRKRVLGWNANEIIELLPSSRAPVAVVTPTMSGIHSTSPTVEVRVVEEKRKRDKKDGAKLKVSERPTPIQNGSNSHTDTHGVSESIFGGGDSKEGGKTQQHNKTDTGKDNKKIESKTYDSSKSKCCVM